MQAALRLVDLDGVHAVGEDALVAHQLHLHLRVVLRELVGDQRMRQREDLLEVALVRLTRDDRGPLGDERTQAARVVEVAMGVEHVLD